MTARHDPNSADYRLQIVSNTGDLYHSSPGSDGLKRDLGVDGLVEELYGSGLYFYYAPADGSLVCYFQGIRNVSEQLYVLYRGAPGRDFFEKFWRRFERELRGSNIDVNTQASGSHEVFRNLRSGTRSTPEFSMSELLELKRNPETPAPVTLGAPDYESAVGVVNWILGETAADLDLAIGGLGWVDDHLSTDVLVQPRGSDGVGAPIEETREHLDRIDLTNRIEETRETVAAATESVSRDDGSLDALAKRLNDAGLRERGLVVFAEAGRDRFASYRTDAAVASFALGLLGALTLAVQLDALGPIVDVLTADYRVEFVGPTSGWVVVLSSAILIGANLVGIVDAERFLGSGGDGPPDPRGSGIDDSHVRDIVSQLAEIATHDRTGTGTGTFGEFEQIAADRIFADCGLDVRTAETVENARRRQMLVGAGVGLLGAIAVAAVFGLVAVVLQRYQTAVMESVLLLGVAGGVGVGYRSARFLASRLVGTLSGVPGPTLSTVGRTWLPFVVGFPLIVDTASRFWLSASAPEDVLFATGVGCLQYGDLVGWAVLAVGLAVGFAGFEFRRTGEYRLFGPPLGALAGAVVLVQTGLPFPGRVSPRVVRPRC